MVARRVRVKALAFAAGALVAGMAVPSGAIAGTAPAFQTPAEHFSIGQERPFGITKPAADLTGDGRVDLAVTTDTQGPPATSDRAGGKLVVMRSTGDGFKIDETHPLLTEDDLAEFPQDSPARSVGRDVAALDVDNDGDRDLVALDAGKFQCNPRQTTCPSSSGIPGWVIVYQNDGSGDFTRLNAMRVGARPLGMGIADFNRDGKIDLGIDLEDEDGVQMLSGNGDGTFAIVQTVAPIPGCDSVHFPAAGDFTGDRNPDLLVPCNNNGPTLLFEGKGDGTVLEGPVVSSFGGRLGPTARNHQLAAADFDRDGALDYGVANTGPRGADPRISVFLNAGGGSFFEELGSPYTATDVPDTTTGFITTANVARARGKARKADRLPDILTESKGSGTANHVVLLVNQGRGSQRRGSPLFSQMGGSPFFINNTSLREVTAGDFNGDGRIDAAVVERPPDGDGSIAVLFHR